MKLHPIYDTSDYELIFNDNMKYENFDSIEVFLKWTFPDPDGNPNVSLPGVNRIILINPPDESKTQH